VSFYSTALEVYLSMGSISSQQWYVIQCFLATKTMNVHWFVSFAYVVDACRVLAEASIAVVFQRDILCWERYSCGHDNSSTSSFSLECPKRSLHRNFRSTTILVHHENSRALPVPLRFHGESRQVRAIVPHRMGDPF
jgi:hypothetical protein